MYERVCTYVCTYVRICMCMCTYAHMYVHIVCMVSSIIDNIRILWIGKAHNNFLTILVKVRQFVSLSCSCLLQLLFYFL